MAKAKPIYLSQEEKRVLKSWSQSGRTEQRLAERARMILALAEGQTNREVALRLRTRQARVSKWRTRFAQQGREGLKDAPRQGAPRRYDQQTERRILAVLDEGVMCFVRIGADHFLAEFFVKRLDSLPVVFSQPDEELVWVILP